MSNAYQIQRHAMEEASRVTENMISRAIQMTTKALPVAGQQFDTDMLAAVIQALALNYATVCRSRVEDGRSIYS